MKHRAVSCATAFEPVPLDNTLEAMPLAFSLDIDDIADLYDAVEHDLLPDLIILGVGHMKFSNMIESFSTGFLAVTGFRFIHPVRPLRFKADLDSIIAFLADSLNLQNGAWSGLHHRHRNGNSQLVVDACHPEFLAQNTHCLWHNRTRCFSMLNVSCRLRKFYLDVNTGREFQFHQQIDGLLGRLENVEESAMGPHFELFP